MQRIALFLVLAMTFAAAPVSARGTDGHPQLVALFNDWRAFNHPPITDARPDYSAAAMAKKAAGLSEFKARLAKIDTTGWSIRDANDYRLVEAEMNGLDFFLRVLKPWARDPNFYTNVFAEMSDVPAHEGPFAEPYIELWQYRFPLSAADEAKLTAEIGAIPALLEDAKTNLAPSTAHDFWVYADRSFAGQSAALDALLGDGLEVRDLGGFRKVTLAGTKPALRDAIAKARAATEAFRAWVKAEAPRHVGPVGVGKADYNWWLKNVLLSPYDFDAQKTILQQELNRSIASLKLEEARNSTLPALDTPVDPAAFLAMSRTKANEIVDLWVAKGVIPDRKDLRAAVVAQAVGYVAPEDRNFFTHVTSADPLPLHAHMFHWAELARLKNSLNDSPIRRSAPLFNIFEDRSEGVATAMEELSMHLGLYDNLPRGRELTWIMLAARAARGLASLKVQAQEMELDEAARFHARWTPRGWADANSDLIGFEQLLYARQPGYGPSYVIGKVELDKLIADVSHAAEMQGKSFDLGKTLQAVWASDILPFALIEAEVFERLDLKAQ